MDKGTLGIHQIEFVVETSPGFGDGRGVGQHAHGTLHLGQVTTRHDGGWLVVDANLEACGAPVHKLDGTLGLDGSNGCIHVLWNHVSTVEHAAGHVFAVTWITLHHLVGRLEAGVGDFSNTELLMVGLLGRDDRCIGDQGEVDTRVGHQVGLELCQIHIQSSVKAKRGSDGGDNLADQTVEVGVGWTLDVQVATADVVDGFIVDHEGTVRVLESGVGGQDGVVGLNYSSGHLGSWVDGKLELRLLAIVDGKTLHEKRGKTRAGTTTEGMEDEESLETCALVGQLTDPVEHKINDLLPDGVVATSIVVGSVFLAGDQLFWVEQLTVCPSAHLICKMIKCATLGGGVASRIFSCAHARMISGWGEGSLPSPHPLIIRACAHGGRPRPRGGAPQ